MSTNGYVTAGYLDRKTDLPISLPMTLLKREEWLILATLKLQPPMSLQFDELQLNVTQLSVDTTVANTGLIANSRGSVYVAIFRDYTQNDPATLVPQGSSADVIIANGVGVVARNAEPLNLTPTSACSYSVVVVNNTRNTDAFVSVTGQLRLMLV